MKAYLWTGPTVLKRYASGTVLVLADSAAAAWDKLKAEAPDVWVALHSGAGYVSMDPWHTQDPDELLAEVLEDRYGKPAERPEPQEFALEALPPIVQWGSE